MQRRDLKLEAARITAPTNRNQITAGNRAGLMLPFRDFERKSTHDLPKLPKLTRLTRLPELGKLYRSMKKLGHDNRSPHVEDWFGTGRCSLTTCDPEASALIGRLSQK